MVRLLKSPRRPAHAKPAARFAPNPPTFDWPLASDAESFLRRQITAFQQQNAFARQLGKRLEAETGTDFFEWTDHLVLSAGEEPTLRTLGFARDPSAETPDGAIVYEHPRATLPRVLLRRGQKQSPSGIALRPEFLADFMASHNVSGEPEGEPGSRYRRILVAEESGTRLEAVERRAYRGFVPAALKPGELSHIVKARELFRTRPRHFASDSRGFEAANQILDRVAGLVGRDLACQFFFEAERAYWESRNRAGRLQKHRQDRLGLGWGNHDHHTFRCSRDHFVDLVEFLLRLGFVKRERYYAGAEAGWGAQISEQPVTGIVVFADVDLLPEETQLDFSTQQLPPARRLGTIGLWVGLHGESLLEAGLHHLEARFDFDRLRRQLKEAGINTMPPFSDFACLRQAFTEGERWPVRQERLERLRAAGLVTREQARGFAKDGALGSHLENLQRHGGFKGFNQKSVSAVIAATDPRKPHFPKPQTTD
jgi:hypothetical protein